MGIQSTSCDDGIISLPNHALIKGGKRGHDRDRFGNNDAIGSVIHEIMQDCFNEKKVK